MINGNGFYSTKFLRLAAFLYANKVPFRGLRWDNPDQATFLFDTPPDGLLAEWMKETEDFIRSYENAKNFLRDKTEGK